jgi:hypothetical protein
MRLGTDVEAIQADWEAYQAAVAAIKGGDTKTYRRVNQEMGYNLVKSLPALMQLLRRAESDRDTLQGYLDKTQERLAATRLELKQLKASQENRREIENVVAIKVQPEIQATEENKP